MRDSEMRAAVWHFRRWLLALFYNFSSASMFVAALWLGGALLSWLLGGYVLQVGVYQSAWFFMFVLLVVLDIVKERLW